MRFAVESWDPEYGTALGVEQLDAPKVEPRLDVEAEIGAWAPRTPPPVEDGGTILFVDGVMRTDAMVWIETGEGRVRPGLCASYAAGVVRCDGHAQVIAAEVRRGLFSGEPTAQAIETSAGTYKPQFAKGERVDQLSVRVQERMGELEGALAHEAGDADLIVLDGPLTGRQNIRGAIGYVKTHRTAYLPEELEPVVGSLAPGQRTPVFWLETSWTRFSWYLRLPGASGHPWAGIVRCEAPGSLEPAEAVALADRASAILPRFASDGHKDPRAPQNLYPIAGLERELRRRLGDPAILYRALRVAARGQTPVR